MNRLCNILCLGLVLIAGLLAPAAACAESISINTAVKYQTMSGWEATARAWEVDKTGNRYNPTWVTYAPAVAARMVNELGINRLQLPLKTGWMNPVDYWTQFVNGQLTYLQWGPHSYQKIAGAPYQFAEFDFYVETMLLPMRQQLQARGEKLYVNMIGTDFNVTGMNGNFHFSQNPAAYAAFVRAYADRLRTKYGVTLDAFEVTLEPENSDPAYPWGGVQIGNALVALRAMFNAAGYPNLNLIAPSVTNAANAIPYLTAIETVPGAMAALTTASYHRYSPGDYAAIHAFAQVRGKQTAMAEWTNATIDTLFDDLLIAHVSSWQKWAVAGLNVANFTVYYAADLTDPANPIFAFTQNTAHLALIFHYVRLGAVRVDAQSATMRTLAFVNPDGTQVVVAKRTVGSGSVPVTLTGLRPGSYGVRTIAAGTTKTTDLPDLLVAANGSVTVTLTDGYTTIYGKASSSPPPGQLSLAGTATFGNQTVGTASNTKIITISNVGGTAATVQSIVSSNASEFTVTGSTCGTVNAGSACSFNVAFKPAAIGSRSGTLTVTSNGLGNPQTMGASGTGVVGASPGQLSFVATTIFANQTVGTTSAAKTVMVSNFGATAVTVQGIVSGNASEFPITSSSCGTVNPGSACSFNVAFKPALAGTRTAKITVSSNGAGSPQSLSATGTGMAVTTPGQLSFLASTTFARQRVGTTSGAKAVTISNVGGSAVFVQSIVSNNGAEFPITSSTCGWLNPESTCAFSIAFRPSTVGTRSGSVTVTSNAVGSPQKMNVKGAGSSLGRPASPEETIDIVEYHHAAWDHYFMTGDMDEIAKLDNGTFEGWARTGQEFKVFPPESATGTSVCRFFSTSFAPRSSHFYTPFATECAIVVGNPDWSLEGEVFMISTPAEDGTCAAGMDPVYRMYNNGEGAAPNHRYTTDDNVRLQMVELGWTPEGYGPAGVIMCAPQ